MALRRKPGPTTRPARERSRPLNPDGIAPYLESHLEWLTVKNYSPDTINRRDVALRRFIEWCDERSLNQPQEITKPILERYQRHLYYYRKENGQPLTLGTQHSLLAPVKTFFKWLTQENHLLYNPASELMLPKQPKRLPRDILSVAEVESILAQPDHSTLGGLRDRALLETLYSTGLRRMELPALKVYDIDRHRSIVIVREGKGLRDRIIPIGERALAWVEKYLDESRPQLLLNVHEEALFLNDYGEALPRDALARKVKHYMEQAGVKKTGSCHLFRHAMATHMLDNGADTRFIQAMLGHADLATTQIYTHVSVEKLKAVHAATHPAKLRREVDRGAGENGREAEREALFTALAAEEDEELDG
ncbi:site-specific tyrosine recombinase XerC [Endothiovibrio diazotrophicus]